MISKMSNRLLHGTSFMSYHHKIMPFAWSLLIDASILAALYSHKPHLLNFHAIGATAIGAITIITSFSSFIKGIPPVGNPMRTHKIIGSAVYLLVLVQIVLGILWRTFRSRSKGSQMSLYLEKMHKAVGYSLAFIAKFQVLYILPSSDGLFWFNLIWDLTAIILLIRAKKTKQKA